MDEDDELAINLVVGEKKRVKLAIDSGAAEAVWLKEMFEQFKTNPCHPGSEQKFVNASRGAINHYGKKQVRFSDPTDGKVIGMGFQAYDVKFLLAAVKKICEKGNLVQLGPKATDN